jgi:hypothetical protein
VFDGLVPWPTHLVLATHVPHGEAYVLVLDRLHVEAYKIASSGTSNLRGTQKGCVLRACCLTDSGDGSDDLSQLQLVKNGRLSSCVESNLLGQTQVSSIATELSSLSYAPSESSSPSSQIAGSKPC